LIYGKKDQREVVFDLLHPFCAAVFLSLNSEQAMAETRLPVLVDPVEGGGPLWALVSAFERFPDVAWLTAPCDLPLLSEHTLRFLVEHRDPTRLATAFVGREGLPEPLVAIWEPAAGPLLRRAAEAGQGPRRVLLENPVCLLSPPSPDEFQNVNTPEDFEQLQTRLNRR
jgi:molybdopterin-guanine dinucleotide biosynthesis protein A